MSGNNLGKWSSIIVSESKDRGGKKYTQCPRPFVTISRESGTGAMEVGEKLRQILQSENAGSDRSCAWMLFDKLLVRKVLKDHHFSRRWARYLAEDVTSEIEDAVETAFKLHPSRPVLVRSMAETILRLASMGCVILVGRGANIITKQLPGGLHVRLIGSPKNRVLRHMKTAGLSLDAARRLMRRTDAARKNYLSRYYSRDIADPTLYDIVINMDRVTTAEAATIIANSIRPFRYPRGVVPAKSFRKDHHHAGTHALQS